MDPGLIVLIAFCTFVAYQAGRHRSTDNAHSRGYSDGYQDALDLDNEEQEEEWPG